MNLISWKRRTLYNGIVVGNVLNNEINNHVEIENMEQRRLYREVCRLLLLRVLGKFIKFTECVFWNDTHISLCTIDYSTHHSVINTQFSETSALSLCLCNNLKIKNSTQFEYRRVCIPLARTVTSYTLLDFRQLIVCLNDFEQFEKYLYL